MESMESMDRLTRRDDGGGISVENLPAALERLADYEDAEADGRLVLLPCKVGDTVYVIGKCGIVECAVEKIEISMRRELKTGTAYTLRDAAGNVGDIYEADFGETFFTTRAEAEAALKAREADGNGA